MKRPMILFTGGIGPSSWATGVQFFTLGNYVNAFERAGADTMLALHAAPEAYVERADALLLTGGEDINPARYGQTPWSPSMKWNDARDELEIPLAQAFYRAGKPIFGICRGIQTLNVALGGTLWQDIPSTKPEWRAHGQMDQPPETQIPWHEVLIEKDSALYPIFGDRVMTNSYHHQAVRDCGEGLYPIARTEDGVIEAITHKNGKIFGIQWHPERLICDGDEEFSDMRPMFQMFVDVINQNK